MVPGSAGLCKANDGEGTCPTQFAAAGETWEFRALGGGACQFFKAGVAVGNPGTCQAAITWDFAAGTKIFAIDNGRTYARGVIRIRPAGDGFHVVLEIGIEHYLYGLGEMPSDWHPQALQAQAIAARSYGVRQAIRYGPAENFDVSQPDGLLVPPVQHDRRPGLCRLVEGSRPVRSRTGWRRCRRRPARW